MNSLPEGWSQKASKSHPGKYYYINSRTGETSWTMPTSSAFATAEPTQVQVRHILKKHSGSRRPASWRCPNITQSKNESIQQITGYLQQLQDTLSREGYPAMDHLFQQIAANESDCGSHERGGDLGMFGRGQMQRSFEEASFALEPQQLSGIVDTDSGIHIILRIR
eukprot:gene33930-45449_t